MTTAPATPPFTELSARRLGPVRRFFVRHPVAMDVVVMLWFGVPALAFVGSTDERDLEMYLGDGSATRIAAWTVALAVAGTVALFWRRRLPVLVAAAMAALGVTALATTGSTGGFELGIAFALYAVAAARRALVTWSAFVVSVGAMALATSSFRLPAVIGRITMGGPPVDAAQLEVEVAEQRASVVALNGGTILVLALLAIAIGTSVRNRRLHVAELIDRANAIARDRDQQAQLARAAERARIAREMHDVVAHSVSVMIALGDGAAAALDRAPDRSRAALEELSATGRSALADMRRVLGVLDERDGDGAAGDGAPLDPQPGSPDLAELVERFRTAGLPVRATGLGTDAFPPDTSLQLAAYRIVQEALTNALRYAQGTTGVELSVRRTARGVEILVVDRGPAVPVEGSQGASRGLIGMRERAAVFGGTVDAGPYGEGWRVRALLPWHEGGT